MFAKVGATGNLVIITLYLSGVTNAMTCDICGKKGARIRRITRSFGRGRATFLIENVPVIALHELRRKLPDSRHP